MSRNRTKSYTVATNLVPSGAVKPPNFLGKFPWALCDEWLSEKVVLQPFFYSAVDVSLQSAGYAQVTNPDIRAETGTTLRTLIHSLV